MSVTTAKAATIPVVVPAVSSTPSSGKVDQKQDGRSPVRTKQTGNRTVDKRAANREAGLSATPKDHVWHHHQDGTTMPLGPREIHEQAGHSDGVSIKK